MGEKGHEGGPDGHHTGGWAGGSRGPLTKRGGQGLLAEDLLVQLLCLLVLVLLQVGCGLRGGPGQGVGLLLRSGNFLDLPACLPAFPRSLLSLLQCRAAVLKARPPATESCLCACVPPQWVKG